MVSAFHFHTRFSHSGMPRFYIPPHAWNPDRLALDDGETHHALSVLRMQAGERATVFNGQGAEAEVELACVE